MPLQFSKQIKSYSDQIDVSDSVKSMPTHKIYEFYMNLSTKNHRAQWDGTKKSDRFEVTWRASDMLPLWFYFTLLCIRQFCYEKKDLIEFSCYSNMNIFRWYYCLISFAHNKITSTKNQSHRLCSLSSQSFDFLHNKHLILVSLWQM